MMIDWPQGTGEAAFATPKKLGQAATRNLLRRRMREAYRRFVPAPPAGTVILWMAKAPALALSFDELRNDMLILARRSYAR
jgi:ribonuclease P protein component